MGLLRITWRKSWIGYDRGQRAIIRSLGLRRLHHTVERPDTPLVWGMVRKVSHLVEVERVQDGQAEGSG